MFTSTADIVRLATVALIFSLALPTGCRDDQPESAHVSSESEPLRIITTIRPLELILRSLVPDDAAHAMVIRSLIAPDASPHGFEPTPSQVAQLHRADLVVHIGLGLDDWAASTLPSRVRIVRLADLLDIDIEGEHEHDHDHAHDHDHDHAHEHNHGAVDEHLWLDPPFVAAAAARCAAELRRLLAERGESSSLQGRIEDALVAFSAECRAVDRELAEQLAPFAGRPIITHHNVFSRLTGRYGLGEPIVLRPLAMVEPTPADLRRAVDAVRERNITAILIEPQFSALAAERLREETGVRLIQVDPLGRDASNWQDLMRNIMLAIVENFSADPVDTETVP